MRHQTVVDRLRAEHPDLRPAVVLLGVHLELLPDGLDPPTYGDLAATFDVTPDCIRKRVGELADAGLVEVVHPETRVGRGGTRFATLSSGATLEFDPRGPAGGGPAPHRVVWLGVGDRARPPPMHTYAVLIIDTTHSDAPTDLDEPWAIAWLTDLTSSEAADWSRPEFEVTTDHGLLLVDESGDHPDVTVADTPWLVAAAGGLTAVDLMQHAWTAGANYTEQQMTDTDSDS